MIKTPIFVIALVLAVAAAAAPIFPPLVQGEYSFRVRAGPAELDAEGVPLVPPTVSVGIRRADQGDGSLLVCVPAGPGETVPVTVTVIAAGDRGELRGLAFAGPDCTGPPAVSDNAAFVFFVPPAPPTLELPAP